MLIYRLSEGNSNFKKKKEASQLYSVQIVITPWTWYTKEYNWGDQILVKG